MSKANEGHCLSSLMKDCADLYVAMAMGLADYHFTDPKCRAVFMAMAKAGAETRDTSPHAIWQQLSSIEGKSPVSIADLIAIDGLQPTSANAKGLVSRVIDASRRSNLIHALKAAENAANAPASTFEEVWSNVAPHIEAAQNSTNAICARSLHDICESAATQIEQPDTRKTVSSGIESWDKIATPMKEGQMITLAGRPGTGKSALAGQIAYDCAEHGGRVAFFSLEMTGEEIVERLALVRAGRDARGSDKGMTKAIREIGKLKTLHIFDNAEKYTVPGINAKCRLLATQKGGLSLVVIDYLTLITPIDRKASREQQVAEISRSIKQMAGGLKVPVLVLAQLNRESEKDERRPRMSDLRESGSIEQDSDRIWFLWNDTKSNPTQEAEWLDLVLLQAKCRGGPANVAKPLRFDRPIYSFFPIQLNSDKGEF